MGWHHDLVKHVLSPLTKSELNLPLFLQDALKMLTGLSKEYVKADSNIIQQRIADLLLVWMYVLL